MTPTTDHRADAASPPGTNDGVAGTARDEAGHLKDASGEAARQVAGTAKEKASDVTADVREQTRQLAGQTREQLVEQAGQQKDKAADSLRAVADELRGMAEHGQNGWGSQLAGQGADYGHQAADFLQDHQPGEILDEVRAFARRKPGTFLLGAAIVGVVAGRLTRALAAGDTGTTTSTAGARSTGSRSNGRSHASPVDEEYLVPPPAPITAPPVAPTTPPPPAPAVPDLDPGEPLSPRFGPGSER
jgi:uncharacterized protein YjbJ (UPF0337 family)